MTEMKLMNSNLSLHGMLILSIIILCIGVTFLIMDIIIRYKANKTYVKQSELPNADVTTICKKDKDYRIAHRISIIAMFVCFITTAIITVTTCYCISIAKKYGAYGDYEHTETIFSVLENTSKGFIDQSEELPENLKGSIIIYFRYGCSDCRDIHDELLECLSMKDTSAIYFVSTRSEKGKELLQDYPVDAVPTCIYIYNTPAAAGTSAIDYKAVTLYNSALRDSGQSIFLKDNLLAQINLQKDGA